MKKGIIVGFAGMLLLGFLIGYIMIHSEQADNVSLLKLGGMLENNFFENVAYKDLEKAILQRESVLYQKYEKALQEIDKHREECTIFGEGGWENAKACYRAVLSETIFGMCAHNNYNWYKDPKNEMRGILAAEEVRHGFGLRIAVSEADEIWEYGYYEDSYDDVKYIICRRTGAKEWDVPEYQLCEEILSHWEASGSDYDEAEWAEWLDEYGQETDGEVTEYCVVDNHVYRIDREKKQLVKGKLFCYQLEFVADGVLMCENLYGMDGYGNPMRRDYFLYDNATEEFYLDKVCQCEMYSGVLIEDRTTLENLRIDTYYRSGRSENISSDWAVGHYYVYPEDGREVQFDSNVIYKNADKEMEKTVNDKVFEIELAAAESLLREFDENIRINSYLNYLNSHIYGGYIVGTVWKKEGSVHYYLPVIIDLESGEFLNITDLISKEELIWICQKGMKDIYRNELSEEERERGIRLIEEKYEDAFRVTSSEELTLTTEESRLYLEITSWGMEVTGEDDAGMITFCLDKEYFIDTPLWHYMEPDFYP